jgi:DNA-binding winged helix-turn-helix (wHTH) protein/Tfp pilus assembly protein PilF
MERERFRIADLTVDVEAVSVTRGPGRPVELPRLSFDLLVALARRAPDVVGTEELIATVWAGVAVSDETLTQRVALLRRALGDEAKNPRYLRVVRGRGYQLVPAVVAADNPRRWWRMGLKSPAAALALAAIALALFAFFDHRAQIAKLAQVAQSAQAAQAVQSPRRTPQPRPGAPGVISTRSASVRELLERAGAYLGRHQESNNELAIELYQRALRLEPRNPQALAGLSMALGQRATKFNDHGGTSDQALALARQAVTLDPTLGRAHHALGLALDSKGQVSAALTAYLRAARLEPQPAAALASAANLLEVQGHLADALEADLHAAKESGGDTPVYLEVQVGGTLALLGFDQAAAVWFERALELRPDNVFAAVAFARMRLSQGRVQEADSIAARAIERRIRRPELAEVRGTVALLAGEESRAQACFRDALAIAPGFLRAQTRLLLLAREAPGTAAGVELTRRRHELLEELRRGRAEGDEWPDSGLDAALLAASLGQSEAAFRSLDTAIDLGFRDKDWLLLEPMLAGLRGDPRLLRRIERIGRLVGAERQRVLGAPWLPPALLGGSAARM